MTEQRYKAVLAVIARAMDRPPRRRTHSGGRARTIARQANPDWTAALADIDRAVELFEAMGARPARTLGRADEAADVDRRSQELGRHLGLMDDAFA